MSNMPRNNHIVPQSHLHYFAAQKSEEFFIKTFIRQGDSFKELTGFRNVDKVCFERDLYLPKDRNGNLLPQLEEDFANKIEPYYGLEFYDIICNIRNSKNTARVITKEQKKQLSQIIMIQTLRTRKSINNAVAIGMNTMHNIESFMLCENSLAEPFSSIVKNMCSDENFAKKILCKELGNFDKIQQQANFLAERTWVVHYNPNRPYLAKPNMPFFISDDPVIWYNIYTEEQNIYEVGLRNPNTGLYFPLSPDILIEILPIIHKTKNGVLYKGMEKFDCCKKEISPQNPIIEFVNKKQFKNSSFYVCVPPYYANYIDRKLFNIKS